jgi:hypothetical protein
MYDLLPEIPSLEVKPSTDQSGGTKVIRGIGSLTNQRNPLIVVNVVIYNGDLSSCNPTDVAGFWIKRSGISRGSYQRKKKKINWHL